MINPLIPDDKLCLELPPDLTFEDWDNIGMQIYSFSRHVPWLLGDWLLFGEAQYGEQYASAQIATGKAYDTLAQYKMVSKKFGVEKRHDELTWSHYLRLCKISDDKVDALIEQAIDEELSVSELKELMSDSEPGMTTDTPTQNKNGEFSLTGRVTFVSGELMEIKECSVKMKKTPEALFEIWSASGVMICQVTLE